MTAPAYNDLVTLTDRHLMARELSQTTREEMHQIRKPASVLKVRTFESSVHPSLQCIVLSERVGEPGMSHVNSCCHPPPWRSLLYTLDTASSLVGKFQRGSLC
ncbi:unnamed protein product [Lepidochelys kempii]